MIRTGEGLDLGHGNHGPDIPKPFRIGPDVFLAATDIGDVETDPHNMGHLGAGPL